jgi:hypothetical protein
VNISESEGNQDSTADKFNRVDILVEDHKSDVASREASRLK